MRRQNRNAPNLSPPDLPLTQISGPVSQRTLHTLHDNPDVACRWPGPAPRIPTPLQDSCALRGPAALWFSRAQKPDLVRDAALIRLWRLAVDSRARLDCTDLFVLLPERK